MNDSLSNATLQAASAANIGAITDGRWRCAAEGATTLWLRGYIEGGAAERLARRLVDPCVEPLEETARALSECTGHFALVAAGPGWTIAAVDWVRSIPVFFAPVGGMWTVDDAAERLRKRAGFGERDIDPDAARALAMAGYTIDRATLYRGLEMLGPGECAIFRAGAAPRRLRYYTYRPWRVAARETARLETELAETTLDVIRRMLASLDGRPLVIPLSAGYDSRLVASAARHLGYKDVRCFSYGRAGNFEAAAGRAIAERLGYRWTFVPLTIAGQRRFFASDAHRKYLDYADTCASAPFVQDMSAVLALKEQGFIPTDAVIANGNSGDFISGMHISAKLRTPPAPGLGPDARKDRILGALVDKHFTLWDSLRTPANLSRVQALLWRSIEEAGGSLGDPGCDHGLYEYAEFQDRQCKYVITGQRIYEFLGHEWRLPLWDNAYLRFWESVPLAEKANQALYARMLESANWGNVWHDVPVNRKTIRPAWLVPVRYAAKLALAPLGARRWHRFERRFFQYWMDVTCNAALTPYARAARDRRGARHAVAWLAADYLEGKGIPFDRIPA
jgi:asparagine synthase (glutamine-hydrolysing)